MKVSEKKLKIVVDGREYLVEVGDISTDPVIAVVNGKQYQVYLQGAEAEEGFSAPIEKSFIKEQVVRTRSKLPTHTRSDKTITAPMPGNIVEIMVRPGDQVSIGQTICVLEAMKMKNMIRSPLNGRIASVGVTNGQAVTFNIVLVTFE